MKAWPHDFFSQRRTGRRQFREMNSCMQFCRCRKADPMFRFGCLCGASSSGFTIVGRNLDWYALKDNSLAKIHAITLIHNGSKSLPA